jgi:hypothetical protein
MNGYRSPLYVESLAEFGTPLHLPRSDAWVLKRPIPETGEHDAIGCYPLFNCGNWRALGEDLDALKAEAIAVSVVVDPFAPVDATKLGELFVDVCRPYKQHAIVDFGGDWRNAICQHHRRNIRFAARHVEIERSLEPAKWHEDWSELYDHLVARHQIRDIARFSRTSFRGQLNVPGIVAFRAAVGTQTVGMLLWYVADSVAYYHLGAFSDAGYETRAAFALFEAALNEFASLGLRWALLGGGAGWQVAPSDGLTRFKLGWANQSRTAWFCGLILERNRYERLSTARDFTKNDYFPKYRAAA